MTLARSDKPKVDLLKRKVAREAIREQERLADFLGISLRVALRDALRYNLEPPKPIENGHDHTPTRKLGTPSEICRVLKCC